MNAHAHKSGSPSSMTHKDRAYTWSWRLSPPGLAEDSSQTARLRVSLPFPAPDWGGERNGKERKIKKKKQQQPGNTLKAVKPSPPSLDIPKSKFLKASFKSVAQGYLHWFQSTLVPSVGPLCGRGQCVYFGSEHRICVDADAGGGEGGRINLNKTLSKLPIALGRYKECTSKEEKTTQMNFY